MYLKTYKPISPSFRFRKKIKSFLLDKPSHNTLLHGKLSNSGRNFTGSITVRHRQKGTKKNYILIDYKRKDFKQLAVCVGFVYNTNQSCFTALIKYTNGVYSYILAPQGLFHGDFIKTAQHDMMYGKGYKLGYAVFLYHLPINSIFFNLELYKNKGAQYARAAGSHCTVIKEDQEKNLHYIKLPTEASTVVSSFCMVTLGKASNPTHCKSIIGKAGSNRKKGFRPTVRGVAMNPVDHPHGGRTKTSSPETTPWGKVAKKGK